MKFSSPEHLQGPYDPTRSRSKSRFQLVETMLWHDGIAFQALHLDRIAGSAIDFGWSFDRVAAEKLIATRIEALQPTGRFQVRLRLAPDGSMHVGIKKFAQIRHGCVRLAKHVTLADDVFRRHQTTCRDIYDRCLPKARQQGLDDLIFSNDRGELTEGAVHSFFIKRGKKLLTPPIQCGVLPGDYRRYVLETNPCAEEQILRPCDLQSAEAMYLTSSLTGMYPVKLLE